ncbi:MAG: response regulator [Treponema sp.]|jgi:CheY-like chemotaxis protein|nr:response regulator [Treponema sp.]
MKDEIQKQKILLVDDEEIQLTIARSMLEDDYEIFVAKSGRRAVEYLRDGLVPHLVLLDILMPEMDGWETFNRIRAMSFLHEVPVAFLTSINEIVAETHAFEMGAADYIAKPYEKGDILKRVKDIMEKGVNKQ